MRKRTKEEEIKSRRREVEDVMERVSVGGKRACINFNLKSSLSVSQSQVRSVAGVFRNRGGVGECVGGGEE